MMREVLKIVIKLYFFASFIFFSQKSIYSYLKGEVIFENINEFNEYLVFPSLTICPKPAEAIWNLKTDELIADMNISIENNIDILQTIKRQKDPLSLVQNYTFKIEDIFPDLNHSEGGFM